MKNILFIFFCAFALNASAQEYTINFPQGEEVYTTIQSGKVFIVFDMPTSSKFLQINNDTLLSTTAKRDVANLNMFVNLTRITEAQLKQQLEDCDTELSKLPRVAEQKEIEMERLKTILDRF